MPTPRWVRVRGTRHGGLGQYSYLSARASGLAHTAKFAPRMPSLRFLEECLVAPGPGPMTLQAAYPGCPRESRDKPAESLGRRGSVTGVSAPIRWDEAARESSSESGFPTADNFRGTGCACLSGGCADSQGCAACSRQSGHLPVPPQLGRGGGTGASPVTNTGNRTPYGRSSASLRANPVCPRPTAGVPHR